MFSFIEDTINSSLNIVGDIIDGEAPSKEDLTKVISAGVITYLGSEMMDTAVDILKDK